MPSRVKAVSPLPLLTNTKGLWDAISNLFSAALRATAFFFLVLGCGEGNGWSKICCVEEEWLTVLMGTRAGVAVPRRASATGISSRDSAESEWYSAGGPAACTGARGGRVTRTGNAGKGRRWLRDEDRVAAAMEDSKDWDAQGHKNAHKPLYKNMAYSHNWCYHIAEEWYY